MPSALAARMTRMAISPRLATSTLRMAGMRRFYARSPHATAARRSGAPLECRRLQSVLVGFREGFDEGMRQLIGGHFDQAAIKLRVQVPVARAAIAAQFTASAGALEARLKL